MNPIGGHLGQVKTEAGGPGMLCARDSWGPRIPVGQREGRQRTLSGLGDPLLSLEHLSSFSRSLKGFFVRLQGPRMALSPLLPLSRPRARRGFSLCSDVF